MPNLNIILRHVVKFMESHEDLYIIHEQLDYLTAEILDNPTKDETALEYVKLLFEMRKMFGEIIVEQLKNKNKNVFANTINE